MYKVLSEMEGREITPVRRTDFSPSPERHRNGTRPDRYATKTNRYDSDDDDTPAESFSSKSGQSNGKKSQHGKTSYR